MKLGIVTCSTRPGRKGPAISDWIIRKAGDLKTADVAHLDLAEYNLPVFDEAAHPRTGTYAHAHTQRWSADVAATDAFVFVTPEYNHNPPSALINAVTYLSREWAYKPLAFVSYGGIAGGVRAVHAAKPLFSVLNAVPISEGVIIPLVADTLENDGQFVPVQIQDDAAMTMLTELQRWHSALKVLRDPR